MTRWQLYRQSVVANFAKTLPKRALRGKTAHDLSYFRFRTIYLEGLVWTILFGILILLRLV